MSLTAIICITLGQLILGCKQQQKLKKKTGNVVEISSKSKLYTKDIDLLDDHERILSLSKQINYSNLDGNIIGEHEGAHYFTIGQRKGLAIGGYNQPLFIIGTNTSTNEIFVGEGKNHPGLLKKALKVKFSEINWVNDRFNYLNSKNLQLKAKIRYRQKLQKISIHKYLDFLYVEFEELQSAITPGQFVAIYDNTQLIASGVIC